MKSIKPILRRAKDETTFFIWYDGQEHQNTYQDQDGGEWLLSYFFDSFEKFHEFVTDYYSITVDEDLLRKLLQSRTAFRSRIGAVDSYFLAGNIYEI